LVYQSLEKLGLLDGLFSLVRYSSAKSLERSFESLLVLLLSKGLGVQLLEDGLEAFSICSVRVVDSLLKAGAISIDLVETLDEFLLALGKLLRADIDKLVVIYDSQTDVLKYKKV
jgi:hypothetical protein